MSQVFINDEKLSKLPAFLRQAIERANDAERVALYASLHSEPRFEFMRLPEELKCMVYENCLVPSTRKVRVLPKKENKNEPTCPLPGQGLLQTSKDTRHAALRILFSRNTMVHGSGKRTDILASLRTLGAFHSHCIRLTTRCLFAAPRKDSTVDLRAVFDAVKQELMALQAANDGTSGLRFHFLVDVIGHTGNAIRPENLDAVAMNSCTFSSTISGFMVIAFMKTQLCHMLREVRGMFRKHGFSSNLRLDTDDISEALNFCINDKLAPSLIPMLQERNAANTGLENQSCTVAVAPRGRTRGERFKTQYLNDYNICFMDCTEKKRGTMSWRWPWPGERAPTRGSIDRNSSVFIPMIRYSNMPFKASDDVKKIDQFPAASKSPEEALMLEIGSTRS